MNMADRSLNAVSKLEAVLTRISWRVLKVIQTMASIALRSMTGVQLLVQDCAFTTRYCSAMATTSPWWLTRRPSTTSRSIPSSTSLSHARGSRIPKFASLESIFLVDFGHSLSSLIIFHYKCHYSLIFSIIVYLNYGEMTILKKKAIIYTNNAYWFMLQVVDWCYL